MSKSHRDREKTRRRKRNIEKINQIKESERVSAEIRKDDDTEKPYVVGFVDKKIRYSTKLLSGMNYAAVRKSRWIEKTIKRIASGNFR